MSTQRDTTVGATHRRLKELGYAPSSASHPDRIVRVGQHANNREGMYGLASHEACVLCYPTHHNGAYLDADDDGSARQVVDLIVTAYLQSNPRELKAVLAVLDRYGLTSGPYYSDGFGNRHHVLQWHGDPTCGKLRTRLCFDSDDHVVALQQAIEPRYVPARTSIGSFGQALVEPIGTLSIPVGCEWKQGHLLDTPHRKLPELLRSDAARFIEDCELARWGARPLAKDAAA